MEQEFTNEQVREMYAILVEIHSTLRDKSGNTMLRNLNVYEIGWVKGIQELFDKIKSEKTE